MISKSVYGSSYISDGKLIVICHYGHHGRKTCEFFNCKEPEQDYYKDLKSKWLVGLALMASEVHQINQSSLDRRQTSLEDW